MRIIGFTFIRDGVKYDYPFVESFRSLLGFCEKLYVAAGDSQDSTNAELAKLERTEMIPTVWDEGLRTGGKIFAQQTNVALDAAKVEGGWGFSIQADELVNEWEYEQVLRDIEYADRNGYDAVRFRFLHFWENYQQIAFEKRWYPHEIRAVKLTPQVQSSGDCQSFSGVIKVFDSDVTIHHYGHARNDRLAYEEKKKYMHRWWHDDEGVKRLLRKSAKRDPKEKTLRYFGPHPKVMAERINGENRGWVKTLGIVGKPEDFADLIPRIRAKEIRWADSPGLLRGSEKVVVLEPSLWQKIFYPSKVPGSMSSDLARPWTKTTQAILRLSEKGVWVD